jgi:hypothetical protein
MTIALKTIVSETIKIKLAVFTSLSSINAIPNRSNPCMAIMLAKDLKRSVTLRKMSVKANNTISELSIS